MKKTALCLALAVAMFVPFLPARAENATLSFSPNSGSFAASKSFDVRVVVNSGGGVGINAAEGSVIFDKSLLSVTRVSKEGSIFSLWTVEPDFSNEDGTVTFSGGSPTPYTKSDGTVVTITFKVLKAGTASLQISNASVLAADGQGTNVLGTPGTASYMLSGAAEPPPVKKSAPPPPPAAAETSAPAFPSSAAAVEISSPTHPDPEKWYSNNAPEFKWKLDPLVTDVSFSLTQKTDSDPGRAAGGAVESKKFGNVEDGTWYFHIRFRDQASGWGPVAHRKVLVDTTAPAPFSVEFRKDGGANTRPILLFGSEDKTSGIDKYEVKIDGRDPIPVPPNSLQNSVFEMPPLLPGNHHVLVRALDKAGNASEASKDFTIEGIGLARITRINTQLPQSEPLIMEGVADANAKVTIRLERDGKTASEEAVRANDDGRWIYAYNGPLERGTYQVSVKMQTLQGAESDYGEKTDLAVGGAPILSRFGWIIIGVLLVLLLGCAIVYLWRRREELQRRQRLWEETEEIRKKTAAIFAALQEEAEEKVSLLDERIAAGSGIQKLSPEYVIEQLKEALVVSQDALSKEIEDVEKAIQ